MSPILQVRIAPPVQLPCVEVAETKVFPAGIGSVIVTPVAALGPWFVTTIVQVMFPCPRSCVAGEPALVTERSTRACTQVEADAWPEPSFVVVTVPVLFTVPEPGQSPPVAPVVGEVMCTVKVLAACVVLPGTVTGPQERTPAAIEQPFWPQPEPWEAIVQDRPAFVGSVSLSVTPWASPAPALNTVSVNPIGLPTFTFPASAVFTILISAALMVDVSPSSPHVPVDASLFTSPE